MRNLISTLIFTLFCGLLMAQTTVSGVILDASNNEPLIGANVMNVSTLDGTITDVDGKFTLNVPENSGDLEVTFVGYRTVTITFESSGGSYDLGSIAVPQSTVGLEEVVITGTMDIVQDRRTPVAVSTIGAAEIQAKGGNVEFPDIMKSTPSIYVAGQAGGYGDSEVFTRGFDQTNTAFLLNGQPINGMEDGKMYWSNWSGMSDVASAVQVQRGLGSSKLAISSVGGTTNIIMKSTEQQKGGSLSYLLGNDGFNKITAAYNTGMVDGKFGLTVLLSHWQGNGWAEGTKGQGQSYFISAGWKTGKSDFNFLVTGAPQWHDQNFNSRISDHYDSAGNFNIKHNGNWGFLNGEHFTSRRNYYHKPVANLNWELDLNDKSSLSTVLYGSWGRGGGSGGIGNSSNRKFTSDGQWDFDAIVAANRASSAAGGDGNEYVLRNSVNNHSWYGVVSTYETILSDQVTWSLGADLRSYRGSHFREVRDLLGASAYSQRANARFGAREITAEFEANPWVGLTNFADKEDRIAYNNDETIRYAGVFSQLEYSNSSFSGYVQGALSNQSHVRFELFNETEANEASEKVSNLGYNLKGGFSINTGANSNVFFNTGLYQRQPFHDNIYLNFSNFVNPVTVAENIFGLEAGYKYASRDFALNFNAYRTSWKDRASTDVLREGDVVPNGTIVGTEDVFQNAIQDQLHTGVELDFSYDVSEKFRLKGFSSIGNWEYSGDVRSQYFDDQRELIYENEGQAIDGVKVGGAAQTTFGLGTDIKLSDATRIDLDYLRFSNLYAKVNADRGELKLPAYGTLDFGISHRIHMDGGNILSLRANIFNLLGTEYISRATSTTPASSNESENWNGVNRSNFVQFGRTRTWNVSARYNFGVGSPKAMSTKSKTMTSNSSRSSGKMDSDGDGIKDSKDACPDLAGIRKFKGCPMSAEDMAAKAAAEAKAAEEARMQAEKEARMKAEMEAKAAAERAAAERAAKAAAAKAAEEAKIKAEMEAKAAAEAEARRVAAMKARDAEVRTAFSAALTGIQFNSAKSTFKTESYAIMDQAVSVMNRYGDIKVLIQGHTDSQGNADNNKALSQKRADAVKEYLVSKGVSASRISTNGLGEDYPIADNNTATGRASNRRVEFIVLK